jgi:hypothetical protein
MASPALPVFVRPSRSQRLGSQYRGDFGQGLIAIYTGYLSDGRFTILKTSQNKSINGLTKMEIFAKSTISRGLIRHVGGIEFLKRQRRRKYLNTPTV